MYEGSSSQLNYSNVHQTLDTRHKMIFGNPELTPRSFQFPISPTNRRSSSPPQLHRTKFLTRHGLHYAKLMLRLHIDGSTLWLSFKNAMSQKVHPDSVAKTRTRLNSLTCFHSFSFISLPMLRHIVGKRIVRVWSTKQCLDAEDQKHQVSVKV